MNTPQETIELVKKWLDDPESVSKEELKTNFKEVADTYAEDASDAVVYAANASSAAYASVYSHIAYYYESDAAFWVKRYEKLAQKEVK